MKKNIIIAFLMLVSLCGVYSCTDVFAGSVINVGDGPSTPAGSGGGGGYWDWNSECRGVGIYQVDCSGLSWLYFQSSGKKKTSVDFVPVNDGPNPVTIDSECSEPGRGFWHFGRNGPAVSSYGGFGDYSYVFGVDPYSSSTYWSNGWGHMNTSNLDYYYRYKRSVYRFGEGVDYETYPNPSHVLYKDGVEVYRATKFGTMSEVENAYKAACIYSGKSENECQSMPNNLRYFCYWDDMVEREVKLTIKSIDTNGGSLANKMPDKVVSGKIRHGESSITLTQSVGKIEGYTKKYWGSGTTSNTWTENAELKYTGSISEDKVVYAVYDRNQFRAWGGVSVGDTYNDNATKLSTNGYVDEADNTGSPLRVDCESASGCSVAFRFDLKTLSRGGSTTYQIERKVDSGAWGTVSDGGPFTKSPSKDGERVYQKAETIGIDKTVCYRITYKPFGGYSNNTTKSVSLCAYVPPSLFEGKSDVSGSVSDSTGWNNSNTTKTGFISNCSPTDGCKVTFEHRLKRTQGIGGTTYSVSRESNLTTSTRAINAGSVKGSTTFRTSEGVVSTSQNLTLYPGMVVCEKLTFKPSNKSNSSDVYTNICASALGNAQPDDGENALLQMKVKNESVDRYNEWLDEVYAKPGDTVKFKATYNPILQYTYYLAPQEMRINNGAVVVGNGKMLDALFNDNNGGLPDWNNAFTVRQSLNESFSNSVSVGGDQVFASGSTEKREVENTLNNTGNKVGTGDAGKSFYERAVTNLNKNTQTTPRQVTFTQHDNNASNNMATVYPDLLNSNSVVAKVPYNFINSTDVTDGEDKIVYAGETATVGWDMKVGLKENNLTGGSYVTNVKKALHRIEYCYNGGCEYTAIEDKINGGETINVTNSREELKIDNRKTNFVVPDVSAGNQVCVRSLVYPKDSGPDDNLNAEYYNVGDLGSWAFSEQVCFTVAKKPSIQVWGGNVYSAGLIETALSQKIKLQDNNDNKLHLFGSWGELGVISSGNGRTTGFASGASLSNGMSLAQNATVPYPIFPLTFSNVTTTNTTASIGNSTTSQSIKNDKSSIIAKYLANNLTGKTISGDVIPLNNQDYRVNDSSAVYQFYANNDVIIDGAEIGSNTTQVVYTAKNVTIRGNLRYPGTYAGFSQMPKLIIYAKNNIKINCEVTQIDALLIADGAVETCADSDNVNNQINSNQLRVNGAIIASQLVPTRTYGAGPGVNSAIPAEIINFDPSLYLWGGEQREVNGSSLNTNLETVYLRELAPRS